VTRARPIGGSPTATLVVGLLITLAIVGAYSWYISGQISGLRRLQTEITDRNRRDSLQLLRIQNDLNQLALAMRDMLDPGASYPLIAWSAQFDRIRLDLDDALKREQALAGATRTPDEARYLQASVAQFWDAANRVFDLARAGHEGDARAQVQLSLQARQSALSSLVARQLVQNNASEQRTAEQAQEITANVQRQIQRFLAAALVAIAVTGLYLIRSNRRLFAQLATLSERRRELAQQLITTREATLQEISRELHDGFGQILTATGSMLGRLARQAPEGSSLRADLREISVIVQTALDNVRGLSQTLHPSILEELGLESTIQWYLTTVGKQLGIEVVYERTGTAVDVPDMAAIHVYRVLQEAVSNVARHAGTPQAWVRLRGGVTLALEVEDHGRGFDPDTARRGLGLVAMRERAELVGGTLEVTRPREGGTLVRLEVPMKSSAIAV
jgi:signal transduction histidine kinase